MHGQVSRRVLIGGSAAAVVAIVAATPSEVLPGRISAGEVPPLVPAPAMPTPSPTPPSPQPTQRPRLLSDTGRLAPNELGDVPILMFHRVSDPVIGQYDITPDAFWDVLDRLYREGYRPIRLVDLVRRQIDVPRGRTPVVLTFDDSSPGQFHRFATGGIDPRSAVGVLTAFARKHPRFRPTATLFLNAHPFADANTTGALRHLVGAGYELGNHTMDHLNLAQVSAATARDDILELQGLIAGAVPKAVPATFALPFGAWPSDRGVAIAGGTAAGQYRHEGVVLAGWEPAPSPYTSSWDPTAITRMCATSWAGGKQDYYANWWLDTLARNPGRRFVASGRRGTVTFPRQLGAALHPRFARQARPYDV